MSVWIKIMPSQSSALDKFSREETELINQTRHAMREFCNNL
jgi:hypothetical protein